MKIALLQINPTVGDLARQRAADCRRASRRRARAGADLAVTPGAGARRLPAARSAAQRRLRRPQLGRRSHALARELAGLPAGARRPARAEPVRRRTAAVQHGGAAARRRASSSASARRCCRPTTSSTRTGTSSRSTARRSSTLGGRRLGISICEDVWNDRDFWKRRRYHHDPIEELVRAGAEAIVNLSASPFTAGKHRRREEMLGSMARKHRVPIAVREPVRRQRRPRLRRPQLRLQRRRARRSPAAARSTPTCVVCDLDERRRRSRRRPTSIAESEIWRALVLGTRDYARKCGFSRRGARAVGRHRLGADRGDRRRGARRRSTCSAC